MRAVLLFCASLIALTGSGQGFTFSCGKDTTVYGCQSVCLTLKAIIPDLRASTDSYTVHQATVAGGCFIPYVAPDNTSSSSTNITVDDRYSAIINLGFNFPFYGFAYNRLIASPNGMVSFDVSKAGGLAHFGILYSTFLNGLTGTPLDLPSVQYDKAIIMGPYHDIDIRSVTSPDRKIQYQVIGTAPYRKWIISYYKVPLFRNTCNLLIENTHQIVLNESTGMVEVFLFSKEICSGWNGGRAIVGMQDFARTKAIMAPGRAATDPPWGSIDMNELWRFTPAAGASLLKRVELYDLANNLISTGTTIDIGNGNLEASFPNICTNASTTSFIVKPVYQKIDDPAVEVFGLDTIRLNRVAEPVSASVVTTPTSCGAPSGSLALTNLIGTPPFQYSMDNGATFQTDPVFRNLPQGAYTVTVKSAKGCVATVSAAIELQNNLTLKTINDTTVCPGTSFTARTVSNGAGFSWSPATGVNSATTLSPVITVGNTNRYIVTAFLGACTAKDTLDLTIGTLPTVNAGPDQTVFAGDSVQLAATASAGAYLWTPAAGLSDATILTPFAKPAATTAYLLRVTNGQQCSATDAVVVTVIPYCVKPMGAFTPNGDGQNDLWLVTDGSCVSTISAKVFNRYGSPVFESNDYKNNWNGTYKGNKLPDGTYYYVLEYRLLNGRVVSLKGNVTILR